MGVSPYRCFSYRDRIDGAGETLIYAGEMISFDKVRSRSERKCMQDVTEQQNNSAAEIATLIAERDALMNSKSAARVSGNSAEYVRCLGRIATIETRLQSMGRSRQQDV